MFVRIWAAITSVIGLAIVAVTYYYGQEFGTWADEFADTKAAYASPTVLPLLVVAFLGFVLLIGGIVAAAVRPNHISQDAR